MAGTDQTHLSTSTSPSQLANKLKLVWPRKGQLGGVELIVSCILQIRNGNQLVVGIKITNKEVGFDPFICKYSVGLRATSSRRLDGVIHHH